MPKATLNDLVRNPVRRANLEARFWPKVDKLTPDECWPWIAKAVTSFGYGRMTAGRGTHLKAHRVSYALANGGVLDDLCVCHRCDNPACCNPAHLFVGTNADNQADKRSKGRATPPPQSHSQGHHAAKLTAFDVQKIQQDARPYREIAADYRICAMTVARHKKKIAWVSQRNNHGDACFNSMPT